MTKYQCVCEAYHLHFVDCNCTCHKLPMPEPVGKCCDNGNFGEAHKCQKQNSAPEPVKCEVWHNCCTACRKCIVCRKCECKPKPPHSCDCEFCGHPDTLEPKTTVEGMILKLRLEYSRQALNSDNFEKELRELVELVRKKKP